MRITVLTILFWAQGFLTLSLALGVESGAPSTTLTLTANFDDRPSVKPDERIELYLNRPLQDPESSIAVFIGTTDVSSLFESRKQLLRYNSSLWPLPLGPSELTVYVVGKNSEWKEVGRFPLLVANKNEREAADSFSDARLVKANFFGGSANEPVPESTSPQTDKKGKWNFLPALTIGLKTQPAQSTFPSANTPGERATFADLTMQASLKSNGSYRILGAQSSFDFAGSSFQKEALRFGTLENNAPKVDLASYLVEFNTGRVKYQVGHFGYGTQRHLINGFTSRGVNITVPFLKYFDFSAAAMNGTQLVGYDNFFGLNKKRHQMLSGTLGVELFPKRAGALRLEVGVLSAYFQPLSGVNRGVITDLQRSRGLSVRLLGTDKSLRFRFEGGFTRSFFASPSDTTLDQGTTVVPLPALSRNAHFIEASYEVLKNFSVSKTKKANLTVAFKEEMVAPLFRSLGAGTQADKIQYEFLANGSIDEITGQFSHVNFHDNLKNIPSILRTLNGATSFSLAAPAKAILNRTKDSAWLPRLGYNFTRVHAEGDAIPVNGGFEVDPSSIPDLIGTNQTFSADWQVRKFTFGYNLNHSFQNNQQTGRELSDQSVLVNTGRVGIAANSRINLNVDLSAESSANKETGRIDRTYRLGPGISWKLTQSMELTANLSNTIAGDAANTSRSRNTEFDTAWIYRFGAGKEGFKKVAGQFFIRYSNRYSHSLDRIFLNDNLSRNQILTANLSFTFF